MKNQKNSIKICISSVKSYSEKTLPIIIPSLINSGIDSRDIFVFEGGHHKRNIIQKDEYTLIQTDHDSFEFTGLIDIVEYEIESDYWFNIQDTCKVGLDFKKLLYNIPKNFPDKIALRHINSMNIGSYKYSYLMKHKNKLMKIKNQDYSEKKLKKLKEWTIVCEDYILYKLLDSETFKYNENISDYIIIDEPSWYGENKRIIEFYPQLDLYKAKANYHRGINNVAL
jgi:hypothetical protein